MQRHGPFASTADADVDHLHRHGEEHRKVNVTLADMEMATNIHMDAIGVDFYHQKEIALRAAGANAVFNDYQHVAHYLQLGAIGEDMS